MNFQSLLLIVWIVIQFSNNVNGEKIPMTLKNWYAKLTTQEEKAKFMPARSTPISKGTPCVNRFSDQTEDGTNTYYCYNIISLPPIQNRQRKLATDRLKTSLVACSNNEECNQPIGINSKCDQTMGVDFIASDGKPKKGICISVEPFPYVFTDFIYAMEPQTLQNLRRTFLPVFYDESYLIPLDDCQVQGNECPSGTFCSMVDIFPEPQKGPNTQHYCYFLPKIPDPNSGHKLPTLLPDGDLALCQTNAECPSTHNQVQKCEFDGEKKYVRQDGTTRQLVGGICAKTAPISNRMYEEYSMLGDNVNYAQRIKYFPVDFEGVASSSLPTECASHDTCAVDEFCGPIYDYSTGSAHTALKYCFKGPHDVPSGSSLIIIIISIIVFILLVAIIAALVVFRKKIFGGSKTKKPKKPKKQKKKGTNSNSDSMQSPKTSVTEQQRQWDGVSTMIK